MANVNLISARRAERVRLTRIAKGMILAAVGTAAVGLFLVSFMAAKHIMTRVQIGKLEEKLTALRPVIQEIDANKKEQAALQPKLTTLTDAQKTTRRWFNIMEGLKRAVPEQTWLTNISVLRAGDDGTAIKINGVTANQSRVGETMYRLTQQAENYKKVDLGFTNTTEVDSHQNVEFELTAQLNQPEPEAAQKKGEGDAPKAN